MKWVKTKAKPVHQVKVTVERQQWNWPWPLENRSFCIIFCRVFILISILIQNKIHYFCICSVKSQLRRSMLDVLSLFFFMITKNCSFQDLKRSRLINIGCTIPLVIHSEIQSARVCHQQLRTSSLAAKGHIMSPESHVSTRQNPTVMTTLSSV